MLFRSDSPPLTNIYPPSLLGWWQSWASQGPWGCWLIYPSSGQAGSTCLPSGFLPGRSGGSSCVRGGGRGLATPGAARWRGLPWGPAAPYSSSPQPLRIPAQGNLAPEPRLPQQGGCVSSLGGVPRARDGGGPAHGEGRQTSAPSAGLSTAPPAAGEGLRGPCWALWS